MTAILPAPAAPVNPAFRLPADLATVKASPAWLALFADDEPEPEPESEAQRWARLQRDYPGYDFDLVGDDENLGLDEAW